MNPVLRHGPGRPHFGRGSRDLIEHPVPVLVIHLVQAFSHLVRVARAGTVKPMSCRVCLTSALTLMAAVLARESCDVATLPYMRRPTSSVSDSSPSSRSNPLGNAARVAHTDGGRESQDVRGADLFADMGLAALSLMSIWTT